MSRHWTGLITSCALLLSAQLFAKETIEIPHVSGEIVVDALLDEVQWQSAKTVAIDIVTSPYDNTPSPISTEAKIFENGEHLYIAFIANDPDPSKIQAYLRDRDKALSDDLVGIKLDTFNDHRLAYKFYANALGVQNDGIENVMTGTNNNLWDGIWSSKGRITETGYIVEFAIPFRILNFEDIADIKTWAIELLRVYPRSERLRISNIRIDRDNDCWVCQMREIKGFKQAKTGKNITITPTVVTNRNERKNIFVPEQDWQGDNKSEVGANLRWGINSSTLLNVTLNPDFSTVEADAGKLSINNNFSLYYDEKRPFFLDNADYFNVNNSLIYTRNIADPDFGAKLTGRQGDHSYGVFVTNDTKTNILVPGNNSSGVTTLNDNSTNAAAKYRYDINQDFSVSLIGTIRAASDYHNLVSGVDGKYKLSDSDTITSQVMVSNTQYPELFAENFAGELRTRAENNDEFSGSAVNIEYEHESEHWEFETEYSRVGKNFRADLGFINEVDLENVELGGRYTWYGEQESWWQEIKTGANIDVSHSIDGELIGKTSQFFSSIEGPLLSYFEIIIKDFEKIGQRKNSTLISIKDNATLFSGNLAELYLEFQPLKQVKLNVFTGFGDAIDYSNDRLGDVLELSGQVVWNINQHAEIDLSYTNKSLEADKISVYQADLINVRFSYQFDIQSYLKLNLAYTDITRNLDNYIAFEDPSEYFIKRDKFLSTQLIYSYKVNPQTVFFLGYSDSSLADDDIDNLERFERTVFMKLSYAWMQ